MVGLGSPRVENPKLIVYRQYEKNRDDPASILAPMFIISQCKSDGMISMRAVSNAWLVSVLEFYDGSVRTSSTAEQLHLAYRVFRTG